MWAIEVVYADRTCVVGEMSRTEVALDGLDSGWQIISHCFPNDVDVDIPVSINGEVAHVDHLAPRELWQFSGCFLRDMTRCFADDLEPADDGILQLNVLCELLHRSSFKMG